MDDWVGLDIGGANLKFANGVRAISVPFPLWRTPEKLSEALADRLRSFEPFNSVAITMTGELADCFESREAGVQFICESMARGSCSKRLLYYQTDGNFVSGSIASAQWEMTAASNWHAMASLIGKYVSHCIVVDVGSTTTDIIPVREGNPIAIGKTDFERLSSQELLYTGVSRTAVNVIRQRATIKGQFVNLAAEYFASMRDVYLLLGRSAEVPEDCNTADGRPADICSASRRLAKMVCLDANELKHEELIEFAEQIYRRQLELVAKDIRAVSNRVDCSDYVVLGEGHWLAREAIRTFDSNATIVDANNLCESFNLSKSFDVGPAYAVYQLARSFSSMTDG